MHLEFGHKVIDKLKKKQSENLIWFNICLNKYNYLDTEKRFIVNEKGFWFKKGEANNA